MRRTLTVLVGTCLLLLTGVAPIALGDPNDRALITIADSPAWRVEIHSADGSVSEAPCVQVTERRIECLDEDGAGIVGVVSEARPEKQLTSNGGGPQAQSASGTNGRVHIKVVGLKLYVQSWQTRARQYHEDGCIGHDAYFYAKPPFSATYNFVTAYLYYGPCYQVPPGYLIDWWTTGNQGQAGVSYVNQTRLCNGWAPKPPLSGFPCITVHS